MVKCFIRIVDRDLIQYSACKIIEVKILEVDIEVIIEMMTFKRGRSRSRKDNIQVILKGMTEVVVIGQDQVQEPVLIGIGLDVSNVGNMIILLKIVQIHKHRKSQSRYKKCVI